MYQFLQPGGFCHYSVNIFFAFLTRFDLPSYCSDSLNLALRIGYCYCAIFALIYRVTQKKRELLKNPTKIEEIQEKKLLAEIEPLQLAF